MNGQVVVERTEDFSEEIAAVKQKRLTATLKTDDSALIGPCAWILPNSLAEYLTAHGINGFSPSKEEYNFIHDWLKVNFIDLMVFPNKNLKLGNGKKAVPTKLMVGF